MRKTYKSTNLVHILSDMAVYLESMSIEKIYNRFSCRGVIEFKSGQHLKNKIPRFVYNFYHNNNYCKILLTGQ